MFWQRSALLALTLALSACLQAENSNSLDSQMYGDFGGSPEFLAARTIIGQSCNGCHAYHTQTEAELKAQNLLVGGDPDNSSIYYRLVGSAGAMGPKDMPQGGALSSSDLQAIRAWILSVSP